MELRIKVRGLDEIKKLPRDFKEGFWRGMRDAMKYVESQVKKSFGRAGRPKVRTGHLRRSVQSGVDKKFGNAVGWVGSDVEYAAIHEIGGVIRAQGAEYLRFQINGQWKSVKQVVIPQRDYLQPGIEDNLDSIEKIIKKNIFERTD